MNDTDKKIGYLKGLLEGLPADDGSVSGKLIAGIVDLLGNLVERTDVMDELINDLNDYVESIDDDLSALEDADGAGSDFSYPADDEEDEDFDEDFDGAEDQLHLLRTENSSDDDMEESLVGVLCPECRRMFFISYCDPDDALYLCPHCSKKVHPIPLSPENAPVAHPIGD